MSEKTTNPIEIEENALEDVNGGVLPAAQSNLSAGPSGEPTALLLPAVQKVREAAARMKC